MRDVLTPNFCKVCIEELWLRLLRRISIIEDAKSDCRSFSINLLPLAQFRTNETLVGTEESYEIVWSRKREGNFLLIAAARFCHTFAGQKDWTFEDFSGKTVLVLSESDDIKPGDTIAVAVWFVTEEIRSDAEGYLRDSAEWTIWRESESGRTGVSTWGCSMA
jgi:hypothetical protein